MTDVVLDASAVLADINDEPGKDFVAEATKQGALISSMNLAEVISKLIVRGMEPDQAIFAATRLDAQIADAGVDRAISAGILHANTRDVGISLADAFCLALAAEAQESPR